VRVNGERPGAATRAGGARSGAAKARFADALRRAGGRATGASAGAVAQTSARAGTARRAGADAKDAALSKRRETFGGEERDAAPRAASAPPVVSPPAAPVQAAAPAELRALVRALPVAVESAGLRAGAPLALSFGRSLDVELRSTPAGVEVVLRPAAPLARACEAELPRVVRALEARGVTVARARVRPRASEAVPPRVDLPPALR
jgi:hypothetical protein